MVSITMVKPNGNEIEVNPKCLAYAKSLGWTEKKAKTIKKTRGRG